MRLAIYGGAFDPIHRAHLAAALEAAARFRLDRVLIVPAARPPHKAGCTHAPYEHRVRMAEIACEGEARLEVSRLEAGPAHSYSIDTIEKVRAGLAREDELFFIIGSDAFAEIRTWLRWRDVARLVRFIVVSRPGHPCDVPDGVRAERLDTLDLAVSSTAIRRRLAAGERPPEADPAVLRYIQEHGLYRDAEA